MEDIITYFIVFGLIIGGVAFWQLRRSKPRPYVLSTQLFPELKLRILIQKQEGKTKDLVVQLTGFQELEVSSVFIELISRTRTFQLINAGQINAGNELPFALRKDQTARFTYPFTAFKTYLQNSNLPFKSFRVGVETENGKKYKSHELAFNKTWVIYRPDSGTYN